MNNQHGETFLTCTGNKKDGNTAFSMYDITTTDNKLVHNAEYYTFSNGKIKSIETFFGRGVRYPGSSDNVK